VSELAIPAGPDLAVLANLAAIAEDAGAYVRASRADNTTRAYGSDWRDYLAWCSVHRLDPLPAAPETVGLYLVWLKRQGRKVATLRRRLSAISKAHQTRAPGEVNPCSSEYVRRVLAGIARRHGSEEEGARPLTVEELRAMCLACGTDPAGVRDRALLLVGFAGAFRRSELAALELGAVQVVRQGLVVRLARSKTDQEGEGVSRGLPAGRLAATCPKRATVAWLELLAAAGADRSSTASLFRQVNKGGAIGGPLGDRGVCRLVVRTARRAGVDAQGLSGHSLRAGFCTSAAAAGAEERDIMRQAGHSDVRTARRYVRFGELFTRNAAGVLGL
jgi:site-specific recombinase XerD